MSDSTRYIVLFRGVGGKTQLPVKILREVLSGAGFENVATYINSGNAVVTSPLAGDDVRARIAGLVCEHMGFTKAIMVRDADEWQAMIAGNPYHQAETVPTTVHVYALETAPEDAAIAALQAKVTGREEFTVDGTTLYLHTPDGMGTSLFAAKIEPGLKVAMTGRNWRTTLALRDLAARS